MSKGEKMRPAFYRLNAVTLDPKASREDLAQAIRNAEAVQERHRLAEASVYSSALRRWIIETGEDWKAQAPEASRWTESAHRFRIKVCHGIFAQCSCGQSERVASEEEAADWHAEHLEEVEG